MADNPTPPKNPDKPAPDPYEGPGKGKAFLDRGRAVAATGNFDYAIDMFIEGLNREPFNVDGHKALRDVGFNRKIKGGKGAGGLLGPKLPYKGKTPKEAMLNNAFLLAKEVGNITAMLAYIRNASLLELKDVVMWIGPILKEGNKTSKSPKAEIYIELGEIYAKFEEFAMACDAIQDACELKPNDMELAALGQRYAAMETMKKGQYDKGGDFKASIKDPEATQRLLEEEHLSKSKEYLSKSMEAAKADYERNPLDPQLIAKYAKSLEAMDDEAQENLAMQVLEKAYVETKIYRFKAGIGNVRMKQFKRNLRLLKEAVRLDPHDKRSAHQFEQLNKDRLAYELQEFRERAEHMPTDMTVKYELGVRYWESGQFDEAIRAFQEAQAHPKHRVEALHFLGQSFLTQGMKPEAVETLKKSIDAYELAETGDKKARELYYWYGRALQANNNVPEAIEVFSKIVQWDIAYRDARKRLNELRAEAQPPDKPAVS